MGSVYGFAHAKYGSNPCMERMIRDRFPWNVSVLTFRFETSLKFGEIPFNMRFQFLISKDIRKKKKNETVSNGHAVANFAILNFGLSASGATAEGPSQGVWGGKTPERF
jgi:hypothetical protein